MKSQAQRKPGHCGVEVGLEGFEHGDKRLILQTSTRPLQSDPLHAPDEGPAGYMVLCCIRKWQGSPHMLV